MPRFAANVSTMFAEFDVPDRFVQARTAGFRAVEFLQPYPFPIDTIGGWLNDTGLQLILVNTPMGDASAGERGLGGLPGRRSEFEDAFELALDYAGRLGAGMIHVMAGVVPDGAAVEDCEATFIDNLQAVAGRAAEQNVRLLLEPLNARDVPGYLHSRSSHTRRIVDAVGSNNVEMQFDFYHLQIMEGDLGARLREHMDVIGHIQFSSVPGRHEPQYGEVNAPYLFDLVDELGYAGWIGCEYRARTTTAAGLSWARPYGLGL